MRQEPNVDHAAIRTILAGHYGVDATAVRFLPLGFDAEAAVYRVAARDGRHYFLKLRFGAVNEPALRVAHALHELGIHEVLAPLRARSGRPSCEVDGVGAVLYPWIDGRDAMTVGLSPGQWRAFGAALRRIHDGGLAGRFRDDLRVESFALPSAEAVRDLARVVESDDLPGPTARRFAAFWRANAGRIEAIIARAEALGRSLRQRRFEQVLCHGDIHAANILVGDDGAIHLIDWDAPLVAPRERDLLFVVGSTIARTVLPDEEAAFFAGYGPIAIDPEALAFFRYERFVEDLGEFGRSVLLNPDLGEEARAEEAELAQGYFEPGGYLDLAETVVLPAMPG